MGWWDAGTNGGISQMTGQEPIGLWGDEPADLMADAVVEIRRAFQRAVNRDPTKSELRAGLEFVLGAYDDDPVPKTQEEKIAFRKEWDKRVDEGKT